jgi:hypothetical protein
MLIKRAGRTLGAGFLIAAVAGFPMLAGAGIAQAQPESSSVCQKLTAALASLIEDIQAPHASLKTFTPTLSKELTQAAAAGSPTVRHDVQLFIDTLQAGAAAGDINTAKLTAQGDAFAIAACTPSGAPATGGGSSAGLQDPDLFGAGGAAAVAGIVVVSVAVRRRPRVGGGAA